MKYLVDTNVISEIRKRDRAHPSVKAWWNSVSPSAVFISVLTLGEIRRGIRVIEARDSKQAAFLTVWLEGLSRFFAARLVPVDERAALVWADISAKRSLPMIDSLIAACAASRDMTFITRNTKDIADSGVRYFNPFET